RRGGQTDSPFEFEWDTLTIGFAGRWNEHEWRKPESLEEQLALFKGMLENLFWALAVRVEGAPSESSLLHPGYRAELRVGRSCCGFFGVVHPELQAALDVSTPVLYAELDLGKLCKVAGAERYGEAIDFP